MRPEVGELVVGEVKEIYANSIEVYLLDYEVKGFLNVSNIPGLWIRDLKKSFRKGQLIICKILKIDHTVELTLKGISKHEKERVLREYGRERKAIRMFEKVCKEFKIKPSLVSKVMANLKEEYGSLFIALKKLREGEDIGLGKEFKDVIERFKLEEREYEFKGILELHSNEGNGVDLIKESLKELKEAEASYLGSSKFLIKLKTKNPKKGEKKLEEEVNKVISKIKSLKGFGEFRI
jgi:translation initiation factor 2 alpha subunit (eIF-2alpha)